MSQSNSKNQGLLRFFTYFDPKEKEFVGVCIELAIIKTGENPYFVKKDLEEAAFGYVETVCNRQLPDSLLNQALPKEYEDLYHEILEMSRKGTVSKKASAIQEPQTFFKSLQELCPAF
ncbi:MAG: hypothetical protein HY461_00440 [Parcubacteria group bacterium]|nr:hypothetical protein [Parcubacteria group bacterium]